MKRRTAHRRWLWPVLSLPAVWILARWEFAPDTYSYGQALADSGDWSAWLLLLTLAVTPLRRLFRQWAWAQWLMRHRRDLGVASFAYAALHAGTYLVRKASPELILEEAAAPWLLAGWIALALYLPLAVTSNDVAVRRLKRSWKKLHRLVYPAAVLVFVHWALSAFDPTTAYIHIGILAAIWIVRLWVARR